MDPLPPLLTLSPDILRHMFSDMGVRFVLRKVCQRLREVLPRSVCPSPTRKRVRDVVTREFQLPFNTYGFDTYCLSNDYFSLYRWALKNQISWPRYYRPCFRGLLSLFSENAALYLLEHHETTLLSAPGSADVQLHEVQSFSSSLLALGYIRALEWLVSRFSCLKGGMDATWYLVACDVRATTGLLWLVARGIKIKSLESTLPHDELAELITNMRDWVGELYGTIKLAFEDMEELETMILVHLRARQPAL